MKVIAVAVAIVTFFAAFGTCKNTGALDFMQSGKNYWVKKLVLSGRFKSLFNVTTERRIVRIAG